MRCLSLSVLVALALNTAVAQGESDRIDRRSARSFDDTVQQLKWAFGGYGLTTVTVLNYEKLLEKMRVASRPAIILEVMRAEWAQVLIEEDPALGIALPVRVYVFEGSDGTAVVSYERPGALLRGAERPSVRALADQLDEKFATIVRQATKALGSGD